MNTRFSPVVPVTPETRAPLSMIPNFGHLDMEETSTFVYVPRAAQESLTDDQIDAINAEAQEQASAEMLEDVRHDMRVVWNEALASPGALNPRKLPIVTDGKLVMLSFPEVLALCGETNFTYVMLADILRGISPDTLHIHLRSTWVDGYVEALAEMGWRA